MVFRSAGTAPSDTLFLGPVHLPMTLDDLRAFEADTAKLVPGFQLAWKDKSTFHRLLGQVIRLVSPGYLKSLATTLYPKVWFPSQELYEGNPDGSFIKLAHERVHLIDNKADPLFKMYYGLPQILALPWLLAAGLSSIWLHLWALPLVLGGLFFLLPWPSPWRVRREKRGYAMTLATVFWLYGDVPEAKKASVKKHFSSSAYYLMSWSSSDITSWVDETMEALRNGTLASKDPVFGHVLSFLRSRGLSKV